MVENKPLKDLKGKSRIDLIQPDFIIQIGHALRLGAEKYAENSWQGVDYNKHYAASMRHLLAIRNGEMIDEETGLHHAILAACNCMFMFGNLTNNFYGLKDNND